MVHKELLCPERIRRIPKSFSWVDHRIVRDGYVKRCSPQALALYLFLLAVADADGLSYWSDKSVRKMLSVDESMFDIARTQLIELELIAYEKPLYQVLAVRGGLA